MKVTTEKLKMVATLIVLTIWSISSFAQVTTMYVMKDGEVVFQSSVSDIDNVTFDEAVPNEALVVHKNDGSPDNKTFLNDIQEFSFSSEKLYLKTENSSEEYEFENIMKLIFDNTSITGMSNPSVQSDCDVLVSVTPIGDVTVESSATIKSLALFSVAGKMISSRHYKGIEKQCVVSLRNNNIGVYLLRIETEQCTAVKKVVKPLNH